MINGQPDYEAEYPHSFEDGKDILHYRGFSTFPDWSTAWGDEIDGCTTFVCRTNDLRVAMAKNPKKWSVMGTFHPNCGDEKGYKVRPYEFIPTTDKYIATAEQNLAESDLSDEEKDEVRALWESYGFYA
jgi:hypothetical protein